MARYTGMEHGDHILGVAARWRDACLIGDGSMLGGQDVWTKESTEAFRQHFVDNLDEGSDKFMDKLRGQIGRQAPNTIRMAAEALWAVYLFPGGSPRPELRRQRLQEIWAWSGTELSDNVDLLSDRTFSGLMKGIQAFTTQVWQQLAFLGRIAAALKDLSAERRAELTRDGDPFAFAAWLDDVGGGSRPSMRHALLFYCYPDSFERIVAGGQKLKIIKAFDAPRPKRPDGSDDMTAVDRELLAIRRRKTAELGTEDLDFYREPLVGLWRKEKDDETDYAAAAQSDNGADTMRLRRLVARSPDLSATELRAELEGSGLAAEIIAAVREDVLATIEAARAEGRWRDDPAAVLDAPGLDASPHPQEQPETDDQDHLAGLFMDAERAQAILRALRERKNVILAGAPGVGKTFAARRLGRALGAPRACIAEVQFHQAYGYEDFVEGFRPTREGGFELRSGRLKLLAEQAAARPGVPHVLIIDEINRGNVSRIFGEALVLLEADKRQRHSLKLAQSGEDFSLPDNLYLLGLMNTADRSLAMVDYAIRRRFAFFTIEPAFDAPAFAGALAKAGVGEKMVGRIRAVMAELNRLISSDVMALGPGYCIGHSYFLGPGPSGEEDMWLRDIIDTQIGPMLREYWAEDSEKAEREIKALLDGR